MFVADIFIAEEAEAQTCNQKDLSEPHLAGGTLLPMYNPSANHRSSSEACPTEMRPPLANRYNRPPPPSSHQQEQAWARPRNSPRDSVSSGYMMRQPDTYSAYSASHSQTAGSLPPQQATRSMRAPQLAARKSAQHEVALLHRPEYQQDAFAPPPLQDPFAPPQQMHPDHHMPPLMQDDPFKVPPSPRESYQTSMRPNEPMPMPMMMQQQQQTSQDFCPQLPPVQDQFQSAPFAPPPYTQSNFESQPPDPPMRSHSTVADPFAASHHHHHHQMASPSDLPADFSPMQHSEFRHTEEDAGDFSVGAPPAYVGGHSLDAASVHQASYTSQGQNLFLPPRDTPYEVPAELPPHTQQDASVAAPPPAPEAEYTHFSFNQYGGGSESFQPPRGAFTLPSNDAQSSHFEPPAAADRPLSNLMTDAAPPAPHEESLKMTASGTEVIPMSTSPLETVVKSAGDNATPSTDGPTDQSPVTHSEAPNAEAAEKRKHLMRLTEMMKSAQQANEVEKRNRELISSLKDALEQSQSESATEVATSLRECIAAMEAYEEARKARLDKQIQFGKVLEKIYARKLASKAKITELMTDTNELIQSLRASTPSEEALQTFQQTISSQKIPSMRLTTGGVKSEVCS